ncbi:MAG: 7-cyano-7-deazaguanine synthase [Candidatus Desantisbacteria bacterium]
MWYDVSGYEPVNRSMKILRMNMKAIVLLSGGLDSVLAVGLMLQQGIEVEAINFATSFCACKQNKNEAEKAAEKLGIPFKILDIFEEIMEIVKHPKHGYGKGINPCIDCHTLMLKKAGEYMLKTGASFIVTGEVLGQRPMSQHKRAMNTIEKESGLDGLVLRPLSAKLLTPTIPEQNGWIDREKLLAISGRSRKPQIALAEQLNITDYPNPAGGCLLTDAEFARRMRDLLVSTPDPSLNDVQLLKLGRHFRLSETLKVIVARNDEENNRLVSLIEEKDIRLQVTNQKGPMAICRGEINREYLLKAASIVARYSDDKGESGIMVNGGLDGEESLYIQPMDVVEIGGLRIQCVAKCPHKG